MATNEPQGLTQRHWIALTALISGVVAFYLYGWKLGWMGPLSCSAGHGCEIAMTSSYGYFFGIIVALIGTIGYSLIFITAMIGTQPRWINDRRVTIILMCLIYPAILFTMRLKYYEWFVLKTFCPWCAVSMTTITLHGFLVWSDWRRVRD